VARRIGWSAGPCRRNCVVSEYPGGSDWFAVVRAFVAHGQSGRARRGSPLFCESRHAPRFNDYIVRAGLGELARHCDVRLDHILNVLFGQRPEIILMFNTGTD
jgi:hypothetical protein